VGWHFQPVGLVGIFSAEDDENNLKWLKVPRGQLTFDAEGNDIDGSTYFSRVAHWPSVGESGITIGRGYDAGQQPNVKSDLESVGIMKPLLSWLSGAKGLKTTEARDYLNSAAPEIRKITITRKQQHRLFIYTYEIMLQDVKRISIKMSTLEKYAPYIPSSEAEKVWNAIDPKIKDLMVDLRYRGDYKPATRNKIQTLCYQNNFSALKLVMQDSGFWKGLHGVPADRFNKRVEYTNDW